MRTRLWIDGRLAWPIVFAIVGFSIWLLVLDYLDRTLTMPFSTLLGCAAAVGLVLVLVGLVATNLTARRTRTPSPRMGVAPSPTIETPG